MATTLWIYLAPARVGGHHVGDVVASTRVMFGLTALTLATVYFAQVNYVSTAMDVPRD